MAGEFNAGFPVRPVIMPVVPVPTQYGAGIVTNPKHLPVCIAPGSIIQTNHGASTSTSDLSLSIPTDFSSVQINTVAKTTVVNIAGSGFLTHVISCASESNLSLLTITITIDQVAYIISSKSVGNTLSQERLLMGCLVDAIALGTNIGTTANSTLGHLASYLHGPGSGISRHDAKRLDIASRLYTGILPSVHEACNNAMPRVRFESNLKVEVQTSVVNTISNISQMALAGYVLD